MAKCTQPKHRLSEAELIQAVADFIAIMEAGKDQRSIARALIKRFGSVDRMPIWAEGEWTLMTSPDTMEISGPHTKAMPKIYMQALVKELQDLDRWKKLADENRSAYRKAVKQLNFKINAVINAYCGIEAHRPQKNQERDDLVYWTKRAHPEWSFGQIANSVNPVVDAKDKIDANFAERIYKRCLERKLLESINLLRPDLAVQPLAGLFGVKMPRVRFKLT